MIPYAQSHSLLGTLYASKREYDKAIAEGERAVALAPGGARTHEYYATSLISQAGRKRPFPMFQKAIRLNPFGISWAYLNFGNSPPGYGSV